MTDKTIDLDATERLVIATTAGPWINYGDAVFAGDRTITLCQGARANAEFIAASRELVPALIAEVCRLRASNNLLKLALEGLTDGIEPDCGSETCPDCAPWRQARAALSEAKR